MFEGGRKYVQPVYNETTSETCRYEDKKCWCIREERRRRTVHDTIPLDGHGRRWKRLDAVLSFTSFVNKTREMSLYNIVCLNP